MRFDSEDIEVAISAYKQAIQQNSNLQNSLYQFRRSLNPKKSGL